MLDTRERLDEKEAYLDQGYPRAEKKDRSKLDITAWFRKPSSTAVSRCLVDGIRISNDGGSNSGELMVQQIRGWGRVDI